MTEAKAAKTRSPARRRGPMAASGRKSGRPVAAGGIPLPGEGKRGEDGYLSYLLRQAQAAARLALERALADLGLTQPQFAALTMLNAYPGLSGADLARIAVLTPQTVGVIIRNLERARLISKEAHPRHGRILQWTLTRRGKSLLKAGRNRAMALERRLGKELTPDTERAVRRWLASIAADLLKDG